MEPIIHELHIKLADAQLGGNWQSEEWINKFEVEKYGVDIKQC